MRDPERMQLLLTLIQEIWQQSPDLRFNQLLYNLQYSYSLENNGAGQIKAVDTDGFTRTGFDLFNLEDSIFIDHLQTLKNK